MNQPPDAPDYLLRNRAAWDEWAKEYVDSGRINWSQDEPTWGIWGVPESQLQFSPATRRGSR